MDSSPDSLRDKSPDSSPDSSPTKHVALEIRARRAARLVGLQARKSRRMRSPANQGGFMLVDPGAKSPVEGLCFELTAAQVIDYCAGTS
jgi:hypothetical protein